VVAVAAADVGDAMAEAAVVAATAAVADQAADGTNIRQNSPSNADEEKATTRVVAFSLVEGLSARFISERISAT